MTDREYFLPFSVFPGIGPVKFEKLIKHFGTARNAWEAPSAGLRILLGEKLTAKFEKFRLEFDIPKFKKQLHKKKIDYVCLLDKQYPSLLKQIPNPPILLFVKWDKENDGIWAGKNGTLCRPAYGCRFYYSIGYGYRGRRTGS